MDTTTALEMMENARTLLFAEYVQADKNAAQLRGTAQAVQAAKRDAYAHSLEMMGAIHMLMQEEAGQR